MPIETLKLLVVDDQPGMAASISDLAQELGFEAVATDNPESFREIYSPEFDVVLLDLVMPQTDGIELIRYLADEKSQAAIILMSGFDPQVLHSAVELARAHGLRVVGGMTKPLRLHDLERMLDSDRLKSDHLLVVGDEGLTYSELKHALDTQALSVAYQPKISLRGREVVGLEALARWTHETRGPISPALFVRLAEEKNLIGQLTEFVLEAAIQESAPWLQSGLCQEVAVNLSAQMLADLDLPDRIISLLKQARVEVSQLVVEITETALMREVVKSLEILTRLRMKGIRLAIDDFGTGYSTMQQLQRYPFTEIKIDRSFVQDLGEKSESRAIVDTTIDLGRRLGMKVVAEGIETGEALQYLRSQGCDLGQGYYIAKPMPGHELVQWVRDFHRKAC